MFEREFTPTLLSQKLFKLKKDVIKTILLLLQHNYISRNKIVSRFTKLCLCMSCGLYSVNFSNCLWYSCLVLFWFFFHTLTSSSTKFSYITIVHLSRLLSHSSVSDITNFICNTEHLQKKNLERQLKSLRLSCHSSF